MVNKFNKLPPLWMTGGAPSNEDLRPHFVREGKTFCGEYANNVQVYTVHSLAFYAQENTCKTCQSNFENKFFMPTATGEMEVPHTGRVVSEHRFYSEMGLQRLRKKAWGILQADVERYIQTRDLSYTPEDVQEYLSPPTSAIIHLGSSGPTGRPEIACGASYRTVQYTLSDTNFKARLKGEYGDERPCKACVATLKTVVQDPSFWEFGCVPLEVERMSPHFAQDGQTLCGFDPQEVADSTSNPKLFHGFDYAEHGVSPCAKCQMEFEAQFDLTVSREEDWAAVVEEYERCGRSQGVEPCKASTLMGLTPKRAKAVYDPTGNLLWKKNPLGDVQDCRAHFKNARSSKSVCGIHKASLFDYTSNLSLFAGQTFSSNWLETRCEECAVQVADALPQGELWPGLYAEARAELAWHLLDKDWHKVEVILGFKPRTVLFQKEEL